MRKLLHLLLLLLIAPSLFAIKSIVPDAGICDTHIRIFNDKAYMYAGRDANPDPTVRTYTMPDWRVFSSDDLVTWKLETIIDPAQTYMGKGSTKCYAVDAAQRNGKYYFYFSDGSDHTSGVLVGDSPIGPFTDPLGKRLLPADLTDSDAHHDPNIFIEDDGTPYIIFGRSKTVPWYGARLNEDMISLAEAPRQIGRRGFHSDQPFVFKRNGIYYLSFTSGRYIMSDSLFGTYGPTKKGGNLGGHGSYFTWHNQWFRSSNNRDAGRAHYRKSILVYVHFKDNGDIVHDEEFYGEGYAADYGVGQYNARWPKIQAEWYFASEGTTKRENSSSGFEIRDIHNGDYLSYPQMDSLSGRDKIRFMLSSQGKNGAQIEIRSGGVNGKLLGSCKVPDTKAWSDYRQVECQLKNDSSKQDIYIIFKGKTDKELLRLDWLSFSN